FTSAANSLRWPMPSAEGRRRGQRRQEAAEGGGYMAVTAADALGRRPTARPAETRSRRRRRLLAVTAADALGRRPTARPAETRSRRRRRLHGGYPAPGAPAPVP